MASYGTMEDEVKSRTFEKTDSDSNSSSTKSSEDGEKKVFRQDVAVWVGCLIFIVGLIGAIFGIGATRGWYANSGYSHNDSTTSVIRFLPEPLVPEPGVKGRYGTDASGRWYYWKLPPSEVTALTRSIPWVCYCLHQILYWIGLYKLQSAKMAERANKILATPESIHSSPTSVYSRSLNKWNWYLVVVNVLFHLIHLGQTHWTYDALAQDVSISSSQSSVIMLLIFIMIIEYRDRGLFFGWPSQFDNGEWSKKLRLPYSPMLLIRKYHGYAFAWAAIYTFWYHPMENTWGHVMGFFHTYTLLLQGSLAYTDFHLNKYWRFVLEVWVTAHGGVVAAQTGGPEQLGTKLWPMFVFGFSLLIVLTQLYGLPFWRKIPGWTRIFPVLVYLPITLYMYSWIPDSTGRPWVRLQEIIRIPGIYYLYFFLIWGWTLLLLWIHKQRKEMTKSEDTAVGPVTRAVCLLGIVLIYGVFLATSAVIETFDFKVNMIALMVALTGLFMIGCSVTNIIFHLIFELPSRQVASVDVIEAKVNPSTKTMSTSDDKSITKENAVHDNTRM